MSPESPQAIGRLLGPLLLGARLTWRRGSSSTLVAAAINSRRRRSVVSRDREKEKEREREGERERERAENLAPRSSTPCVYYDLVTRRDQHGSPALSNCDNLITR